MYTIQYCDVYMLRNTTCASTGPLSQFFNTCLRRVFTAMCDSPACPHHRVTRHPVVPVHASQQSTTPRRRKRTRRQQTAICCNPQCPLSIIMGFSLADPARGEAILHSYVDIDNRDIPMLGWHAVHVSKTRAAPATSTELRRLCPHLKSSWKTARGAVVGLVYFSKSMRYKRLCDEAGCQCVNGVHSDACSVSPFAKPARVLDKAMCNLISCSFRMPLSTSCIYVNVF